MTIKQALVWTTNKLKISSPTSPLDTEVLLSFVIKKPKEFLYTHPEVKLTASQNKKLKSLVNRRVKGEPIAYLTNHKEFYGLDFFIDKHVLVPRSETELLVEETLIILKTNKPKTVADIGTGSGCIAIALAKNCKPKTISYYATDISKLALRVAKKNAKKYKVKIKFLHGNLLEPLKNKKIDIVIANLPYLEKALPFEPKKAFLAGKQGLELYQKLFEQIIDYNLKPKFVIIEIDPRQTNKIKKIIRQYLSEPRIKVKKDLAGLDRVIIIALNN